MWHTFQVTDIHTKTQTEIPLNDFIECHKIASPEYNRYPKIPFCKTLCNWKANNKLRVQCQKLVLIQTID